MRESSRQAGEDGAVHASPRLHLAYMLAFGFLGWAGLTWASQALGFAPAERPLLALPFVLFLVVITATRCLAFRVLPGTMVSLDSAFFVASVVCLGSVASGWLVAVSLSTEALIRRLGKEPGGRPRRGATPVAEVVLYCLFFGGMTGGLLMAMGLLFGVDHRPLGSSRELPVLVDVTLLGSAFLVAHYLVQGVRHALAGHPFGMFVRRMAIPGVLAEASLLPLGAVVVLIYDPERPVAFCLLGATYLLINFVVNRLSHATDSLKQRLGELETLNRTSQTLAASLQLHELVEAIARATLDAFPGAELITLSHHERDGTHAVVDYVERGTGRFQRLQTRIDDGLGGWVAEHRRALCVPDLTRAGAAIAARVKIDPGIRSWLGVPLVVYDEVLGVLSVQSRERGAFGADQQRLLEALGAQAAVALQNARLYELATVDGLTGLYVRRYFDARLREELERSRRFGAPFSLILLDIDDFKRLNDSFGHALGDRVLREVAQLMRRDMRGVDIAARYGGEEFAFILPRTAMVEAHAVAERIRQDVHDARLAHDGRVLRVTVSLGVACYPESGATDAAQLLEQADIALYRAKAAGKDRVELYWTPDAAASPPRRARTS